MSIQAIDKRSVHRICSGQVVLDLATAVKELVENSLDAGATSIEVKLKEYGGEMIEVADNGSGVSPDNYQGMTLKYHTSKLSDFTDLQSLASFGFRGEALSSLCALADVSILTKTKDDEAGTRLSYDHSGLIVSQESAARQTGTTVYVGRLFGPLPVRHKEFTRNIRREYGHMVSVLQAYALISKHVRLVCTNQTGKTSRSTVLRTQGSGSMKENVVNVFGPKTVACLDPVDVTLQDDLSIEGFISKPGSGSGRASGDRQFYFVNGRPVDMPKISKLLNEIYKSFNSQQYPMAVLNFRLPTTAYDVNVTPDKRRVFLHAETCFMAGLRTALGSLYAPDKYSFSVSEPEPSQKSFTADFMTQVELEPTMEVDAACEEKGDKPEESPKSSPMDMFVFSHEPEKTPLPSKSPAEPSSLKKSVQGKLTSFLSQSKRKGAASELLSEEPVFKRRATGPDMIKTAPSLKKTGDDLREEDTPNENSGFITEEPVLRKSCSNTHYEPSSNKFLRKLNPVKLNDEFSLKKCSNSVEADNDSAAHESTRVSFETPAHDNSASSTQQEAVHEAPQEVELRKVVDIQEEVEICKEGSPKQVAEILDVEICKETSSEVTANDDRCADGRSSPTKLVGESEPDNTASFTEEISEVRFNLRPIQDRIRRGWIHYDRAGASSKEKQRYFAATVKEPAGGNQEKEAALASAVKELERSFKKSDFRRMKVVGQFNLGFIIARLDDDLFIIDQHASDEKYNFERLAKSTILNKQPLLRPLPLNLSASEEISISTYMETFRRNGFEFIEKEDAPPGERMLLASVPFSKNVTFGPSDVQELISLVSEERGACGSDSYLVRPTRVRAMLASRACRSSVMIGDALSKKEMEKVVSHLADLDAPWNCPHGRPTMRHLYYLKDLLNLKERPWKFPV